jgi:hypothetical protein
MAVSDDFARAVERHIDELRRWEAQMVAIEEESALQMHRPPILSECDSAETYAAALRHFEETKKTLHHFYPAPSADIDIERAIEVETSPDGVRTYRPVIGDTLRTVERDQFVQINKNAGNVFKQYERARVGGA